MLSVIPQLCDRQASLQLVVALLCIVQMVLVCCFGTLAPHLETVINILRICIPPPPPFFLMSLVFK
jgi:hypothetical protein